MSGMNISPQDPLPSPAKENVAQSGDSKSSKTVRALTRNDQQRTCLRDLLLAGAQSPPVVTVSGDYFKALRKRLSGKS